MTIEDIKVILDKKGMSLSDLAQKMGKERSVVYKTIQNGNPTLSFLMKLSGILEMSIDSIVNQTTVDMTGLSHPGHVIDGFVEIDGEIHRVKSKPDIERVLNILQNSLN